MSVVSTPQVRSRFWSNVALAFCGLEFLLAVIYAILFFKAGQPQEGMPAIFGLREWLLPAIPFVLLVHFFVLGVWVFMLYADMARLFKTRLNAQRAMMLVVIPIVNIYGYGKALARLVAEADRYSKEPVMKRQNGLVKYGLVVLYGCLSVILLTLYYSINVPFNMDKLNDGYFQFFNGLQFTVIIGSIAGLAVSVVGCQRVLHQKQELDAKTALN